MGNAFLFPKTPATYGVEDVAGLFWVPDTLADAQPPVTNLQQFYKERTADACWIPCQYFKASSEIGRRTVFLYFHGNSCDLGDMMEEMKCIRDYSHRHIVHFEYPGYGICNADGLSASAPKINQWARAVATFLIALGVPARNIVPFGRSIGTGPAATLAHWLLETRGEVGGCILQSPYTSIHDLVKDYAWAPATWLFNNDWDTKRELEEMAERGGVPLLVVHGEIDEVIPVKHGRELVETYAVPEAMKQGVYPRESRHNSYYVLDDLVHPIDVFVRIKGGEALRAPVTIELPTFATNLPSSVRIHRQRSTGALHSVAPTDAAPTHREDELIAAGAPVHRRNYGLLNYLWCCASPQPVSPEEIIAPPSSGLR